MEISPRNETVPVGAAQRHIFRTFPVAAPPDDETAILFCEESAHHVVCSYPLGSETGL